MKKNLKYIFLVLALMIAVLLIAFDAIIFQRMASARPTLKEKQFIDLNDININLSEKYCNSYLNINLPKDYFSIDRVKTEHESFCVFINDKLKKQISISIHTFTLREQIKNEAFFLANHKSIIFSSSLNRLKEKFDNEPSYFLKNMLINDYVERSINKPWAIFNQAIFALKISSEFMLAKKPFYQKLKNSFVIKNDMSSIRYGKAEYLFIDNQNNAIIIYTDNVDQLEVNSIISDLDSKGIQLDIQNYSLKTNIR